MKSVKLSIGDGGDAIIKDTEDWTATDLMDMANDFLSFAENKHKKWYKKQQEMKK